MKHTTSSCAFAQQIFQDPEANLIIRHIRHKIRQQPISDLFDEAGHQYVDLMLDGRGVFGIALLGYVYALEQAGIRFLNLAGSSSGALVATLLAAADRPEHSKAIAALALLEQLPFQDCLDGGYNVQRLMTKFRQHPDTLLDKLLPLTKVMLTKLVRGKWGCNAGDAFEQRLADALNAQFGICNQSTLSQRMQLSSPLKVADTHHPKALYADYAAGARLNRLALLATELTTQRRVEFPKHAALYWPCQYEHLSMAKFVRAAMATPLLMQPFTARLKRDEQVYIRDEWREQLDYQGHLPNQVYLVEANVSANMPIQLFHVTHAVPLCPTFGVRINTVPRQTAKTLSSFGQYLAALLQSPQIMGEMQDTEINLEQQQLVAEIDLSEHQQRVVQRGWKKYTLQQPRFSWLDTQMEANEKFALFMRGMQAAKRFICEERCIAGHYSHGFDWAAYKQFRAAHLAESAHPLQQQSVQVLEQAKMNAGLSV